MYEVTWLQTQYSKSGGCGNCSNHMIISLYLQMYSSLHQVYLQEFVAVHTSPCYDD